MSKDTYSFFADRKTELKATYAEWEKTYAAWQAANPEKAAILQDGIDGKTPSVDELFAAIPEHEGGDIATRIAGSNVIQGIAAVVTIEMW